MGRKSRDKGASGERELARELTRLLGVEARRGCQYHGGPGSPDVATDIPDVHIECKRTERLRLYEALEQAIDSGADFITFNRGDLVHGMTGGKLEGHQEYYDRILPKNVNKLLAKLEKQHRVKLPRLEDLRLKTESGPELGLVKGFALTPELKELFKGTGISAYREGGQVKMRSGVMALPGNGVVR